MLTPLMARVGSLGAPRIGPPLDPVSLRLLCGYPACEELGSLNRLDGARLGVAPGFVWDLTLPAEYAEHPKGSNMWRRGRVRRARLLGDRTGTVGVFRDREGRLMRRGLYLVGGATQPEEATHPIKERQRTIYGQLVKRHGFQVIGLYGRNPPAEWIIECRRGHRSHLTVGHLEQEVERVRQSAVLR